MGLAARLSNSPTERHNQLGAARLIPESWVPHPVAAPFPFLRVPSRGVLSVKYQKSFVSLAEAIEIIATNKGISDPKGELLTAFREGTLIARGVSAWGLPPSPAPYPPDFKLPGTNLGEVPILWWRSGEVDWKSSAVSAKPLKEIKQWRLSQSGEGRVGMSSRRYTGLYADEVEVSRNELLRFWPELSENVANPSERSEN